MGCGASTVGVAGNDEQTQTGRTQKSHGSSDVSGQKAANGIAPKPKPQRREDKTIDTNGNNVKTDQTPVPKSIAFDVSLDGQNTELLLTKKAPQRLQTLEPLDVPKLSAEQLADKQRQAEEKRNKVRQKRASASKKASRRRQELMKAKEFEVQQQLQQEKVLDEQQKQVELKREARLREVQEKQRLREERAKRARERAKRINQGDEGDDIDVEKDDQFNASDADSWLGDDEVTGSNSPTKQVHGRIRHTASASTVDSYDAAFQRQPHSTVVNVQSNIEQRDDDFFG